LVRPSMSSMESCHSSGMMDLPPNEFLNKLTFHNTLGCSVDSKNLFKFLQTKISSFCRQTFDLPHSPTNKFVTTIPTAHVSVLCQYFPPKYSAVQNCRVKVISTVQVVHKPIFKCVTIAAGFANDCHCLSYLLDVCRRRGFQAG
jgi:hypothetical protein